MVFLFVLVSVSLATPIAVYANQSLNTLWNAFGGLDDSDFYLVAPPPGAIEATDETDETVFSWHPRMIEGQPMNWREEGLDIRGEIPELTPEYGEPGLYLNQQINDADCRRQRRQGAFHYLRL
jgi:hypothetical protein